MPISLSGAAASAGSSSTSTDTLAVDTREAARLLSVCERTVASLIASGELKSFRLGRARRIPLTAIHALIERRLSAAHSA